MEKKYSIQVPQIVRRFTKIYHLVGLWKSGGGNVSLQQKFYFTFFNVFNSTSFIGMWTIDDIDNTVFLAVLFLILAIQTYRLYFIMWKQNPILDFLHKISVNSTDDYRAFSDANYKIKYLFTLAVLFLILSYTLCVGVVCLPLIKMQLLFDIAFPWDYKTNSVAFWMAYATVAGGYILSITLVMFTTTVWYMMLIFVIKYDLLANDFRSLGVARVARQEKTLNSVTKTQAKKNTLTKDLTRSVGEETSYVKNFVEAIKRLETINEQLEEFESRFSTLFLLQIITSSICICGTTFVLAFMSHDNVFQYVFYTIEIIYCFADIFAVLYLANEIMLSSDRLSYALFESNWITQTQSCKKYIIIVVEYLKQPRQFIVGKLFALNLETFTLIVKRSFSMFNILRNFKQ
uniref:Odorant receptor n=1 Tax=Bradysia odoriphaga TaxID=1564500 RepID=A0A6B9C9V5_9DIPT|nr:odorant receptor 14 [Bradysia odoriphaga]